MNRLFCKLSLPLLLRVFSVFVLIVVIATWIAGHFLLFGISHTGTTHVVDDRYIVKTWKLEAIATGLVLFHYDYNQTYRHPLVAGWGAAYEPVPDNARSFVKQLFASDLFSGKLYAGFGYGRYDLSFHPNPDPLDKMNADQHMGVWVVPTWSLVLAAMFMFSASMRRPFMKWWRAGHGKCETCGYDLRASKDRCPECGAPFQGISIEGC